METIVRNRDLILLSQVVRIMQDIRLIEERRKWQYERMFSITQHISGMPGGGRAPHGLDEAFSALSELDHAHGEKCREYVMQLKRAEKVINQIESAEMRTFVVMKYMTDAPDTEIREALNMTRRGFERARRCVEDAACMAEVKWMERYIHREAGEA